jgi:hypothetical protein
MALGEVVMNGSNGYLRNRVTAILKMSAPVADVMAERVLRIPRRESS